MTSYVEKQIKESRNGMELMIRLLHRKENGANVQIYPEKKIYPDKSTLQ